MASQRTVATPAALQAAQQMISIINGQLQSAFQALDRQAQTLMNKNEWDGRAAQQFQGTVWPAHDKQFKQIEQELTQLQQQLRKVVQDIMTAGAEAI